MRLPPFTDNKTLQYFYFTNILPRTDNRTKYYLEQMLEQHKKLTPEELPARGPVIKETRKKKCRVGGGTITTEHVSCALCENKSLFCVLEDIWWLCARCTALECNNLGSISKINFKKVSVKVKKIRTDSMYVTEKIRRIYRLWIMWMMWNLWQRPWSQKRNATCLWPAGVAAFAAFNHLQQEMHMKRNFYKLELIQGEVAFLPSTNFTGLL